MSADDEGSRAPGPLAKAAASAPRAAETPKREDVVLVHGPTEGGDGVRVIRKREDTIEIGEIRPMQEGKPIHGEVVRLKKREESDRLFDVEVLLPGKKAEGERQSGPAQVATDAYRANWDVIFGPKGELN